MILPHLLATAALALAPTALAAAPEAPAAEVRASAPSQALLHAEEQARAERFVADMMAGGINVPLPVDVGGGATHEQHKRNYRALALAGELYRITGEARYRDYVRDMLLEYAALYPRLGPHPARSNQQYGRLFWQNLNDAVWLVNAIQGYEPVRGALGAADRVRIDTLFRQMAEFMSVESDKTFNRIHNHATWSTAGVGMTGYVLGDRDLVERALMGSAKDGKTGFLRQIDLLLSPDGYYAEGPYYQRYALWPFVVFAEAIDRHDPGQRIFERRDGVLVKAVTTAIHLTYAGRFMSFNDAMRDKSLNTEELYQGVAIAYARTRDPALLGIAARQGRVAFSEAGERVARDLAAGLARPFPFGSLLLRDGADGTHGAVALIRRGDADTGQALVVKNSSLGMGHGHFDKLSWQFYDNGAQIVTDYGAARFLNIPAKDGGKYLPENDSWAKQTIAHNTLVVDERSHFGASEEEGERHAPRQLHFADTPDFAVSIADIDSAYPGVGMTRTLASVAIDGLERPVVVDLLRVKADGPRQFDLPLHYDGHLIEVGPKLAQNLATRPVLGRDFGYQHVWVDATATPDPDRAFLTWQNNDRFYTWRWVPQPGAQLILAESGANDPNFNLRREPFLIQRLAGASQALFAGVLESHGRYDGAAEQVVASASQIRAPQVTSMPGYDVLVIETLKGARVAVAVAHDTAAGAQHTVTIGNQTLRWRGPAARIALPPATGDGEGGRP
jgi:hypothetical protein